MDERHHRVIRLWLARITTVLIGREMHQLGMLSDENFSQSLEVMMQAVSRDAATLLKEVADDEA